MTTYTDLNQSVTGDWVEGVGMRRPVSGKDWVPCSCLGCYNGYECNNIWYGEPEESTFEQTVGPYQAFEELRDNVEKYADAYLETRNAVHPEHYKQHPTGIEAIDIIEHASSPNLANVIKYVWRVLWGSKGKDLEDLSKAAWYLQREIEKRSLK